MDMDMGDLNAMEIDPPNKTQLEKSFQMFGVSDLSYEDVSTAMKQHTDLHRMFLQLFRKFPWIHLINRSSLPHSPLQSPFPSSVGSLAFAQIFPTDIAWL